MAAQSQLNYLALESVMEAMKELSDLDEEQKLGQQQQTQPSDQTAAKKSSDEKKHLTAAVKKPQTKTLKWLKKGAYQIFELISKSYLNTRFWLKARQLFVQYMFNQLNDAGKAKGNDENIIKDFGDLKYYCDRGVSEASDFYDMESKGFFQFIDACLDLIRGVSLQDCVAKLERSLQSYESCRQLSAEGLVNFLKASILKNDLAFSLNILSVSNANSTINKLVIVYNSSIENLLAIQKLILDELKVNGGETVEFYLNKEKAFFDNVCSEAIRNIFNPLYYYLVHVKLRLGSSLILRSSYIDNSDKPSMKNRTSGLESWTQALNVLASGIEINKV